MAGRIRGFIPFLRVFVQKGNIIVRLEFEFTMIPQSIALTNTPWGHPLVFFVCFFIFFTTLYKGTASCYIKRGISMVLQKYIPNFELMMAWTSAHHALAVETIFKTGESVIENQYCFELKILSFHHNKKWTQKSVCRKYRFTNLKNHLSTNVSCVQAIIVTDHI